MKAFLSSVHLPYLSEEDRSSLDQPFSTSELIEAINLLSNNKSRGEDGFPLEFYKEFKDLLVPYLMEVLNQAKVEKSFPDSFSNAIISVILKKDKDPNNCASYRPISLLNVDYKIVTKMVAKRLETRLPQLINPDQTGFVVGRLGANNLRRVFNIIHTAKEKHIPGIVASLDAEKAFEWSYLFEVLKKFGFGTVYIELIQSLYKSPKAKIITNGIISSSIPLYRGCRQGCPISPALFALAIEPLAEAIRCVPNIKGFKTGPEIQKISLFADDILLFLTDPVDSLSNSQNVLQSYSTFSGYKVNIDKSEILPLSGFDYTSLNTFSFKCSPAGIKYLGIHVDGNLKNLYKFNLANLLEKTGRDLTNWMDLPLTLSGRINAVKMNVLPRFLYVFHSSNINT